MIRGIGWKGLAVLAILFVILALQLKLLVFVGMLIAVVVVSLFIQQFHLRIIGLELVTFATVITGVAYGPFAGAIVGIILVLIHLVLSGYFGVYYVWVVPGYALAGYLASAWGGQNIVTVGLNITILLQIINLVLTFLFDRYSFFSHIVYSLTNIAFNFMLFAAFGPAMLAMVG